ncbi:Vitellogenin-2 [Frankliniella fusca]|uniref:Vitellogenin-2 n=1 Tax=Frankliniella fusca TaxID=407009 RepID=A0AAE1LDC2_9NEOP|nr:Vitellogenin-2 [Frankliniella fusca]
MTISAPTLSTRLCACAGSRWSFRSFPVPVMSLISLRSKPFNLILGNPFVTLHDVTVWKMIKQVVGNIKVIYGVTYSNIR